MEISPSEYHVYNNTRAEHNFVFPAQPQAYDPKIGGNASRINQARIEAEHHEAVCAWKTYKKSK